MSILKFWGAGIFTAIVLTLASCGQVGDSEASGSDLSYEDRLTEGFQLLESSCFTCHTPHSKMEARVAPPMAVVKNHYVNETTTKEEYIADMTTFLEDPSAENARLPGAVDRFGVMPRMDFSNQQISYIAEYLFETEIEKPDWYDQHYRNEHRKYLGFEGGDMSYEEMGLQYAVRTKAVLGKELINAIQREGTAGAIEFCNHRAIAVTDSMAKINGVSIRRVSDRTRNPVNAASSAELEYITIAKQIADQGGVADPQIQPLNGKMVGYYPITTSEMCLQCHGHRETDLTPSVFNTLNQLYPDDRATGYSANEVRGIWVVEMYR